MAALQQLRRQVLNGAALNYFWFTESTLLSGYASDYTLDFVDKFASIGHICS